MSEPDLERCQATYEGRRCELEQGHSSYHYSEGHGAVGTLVWSVIPHSVFANDDDES